MSIYRISSEASNHPDKGRQYRELVDIQNDCIPQQADFTNFQQRCGAPSSMLFSTW